MQPFAGWNANAVSLVERAIAAHGGAEAWRSTASIRLPFLSGSGALLAFKGFQRTFPAPRECEILPHECVTRFLGYPDDQHRTCFDHGDVRIESADGRDVHAQSRDHRRTFRGLAKFRRWSPLDAAYFVGYALWHYHVLPFSLSMAHLEGVLTRRGAPVGIDVVFPESVPTHCRRQQFYFDTEGRIARHDYVAEVIGPMAWGAHFWEDYAKCGGLQIARRRRVMVRLGSYATPFDVWRVQFGEPAHFTAEPGGR